MKQFTEIRHLSSDKLRALCIREKWYTYGTNEEYCGLFAHLHDEDGDLENMTTEKLAEIAADIMEHSEDDTDLTITTAMYLLAQQCDTYFIEV